MNHRATHRFIQSSLRAITGLSVISVLALGGCASKTDSAMDAGAYPMASQGMAEAPAPMDAPAYDEEMHVFEDVEQADGSEYESAGEASPMAPPPTASPVAVAKEESKKNRRDSRRVKKGKHKRGSKAYRHSPNKPAGAIATMPPQQEPSTEGYDRIAENDFTTVHDDALSTFSIDVDTASYANTRRFLNDGSLPPADAVRIEEMINYFSYDYPAAPRDVPFSVTTEVSDCPWNPDARLVHIGLEGQKIAQDRIPPRNLVFLLDVSGSMNDARKLPLLKQSLEMLVAQLDHRDRVSIVVYAGASGVVLDPTPGDDQGRIMDALNRLSAGGSTNGGAGIELAYQLAQRNFDKHSINRVILATDGDFNVGTTSRGELERLIEHERKSGVFLSVLGFGSGNVKDSQMEMLADKGNGNYAYIDSAQEAKKVLVREAGSTLVTIAKDVKIQVEFNPQQVASYRLVGYENRALAHRDFNDDTKDAGEIGAGHTVTALYEVIPANQGARDGVDPLRYQHDRDLTAASETGELMLLKLRYKHPRGAKSRLVSFPVRDLETPLARSTENFRYAAAVAEFGMLLRKSKHAKQGSYSQVRGLAEGALGQDRNGYRREFLSLVDKAARLMGDKGPAIAR